MLKQSTVFIVIIAVNAICCFCEASPLPRVIVSGQHGDRVARELQKYLHKVTGKTFCVIEESKHQSGQAAFYVGWTKFAKANGIDFSKFKPDEWLYQSKDNSLVLGGDQFSGIAFAVYKFLENEVGVYWLAPYSEYVPKNKNLTLGAYNKRGKPAFKLRMIYSPPFRQGYARKYAEDVFREKNRGNFWRRDIPTPLKVSRAYYFTHNHYSFVDPQKYYANHPEYFSMGPDGKRTKPFHHCAFTDLCLSNREVWKIALNSLRKFIKKDRAKYPKEKWPETYPVIRNDGMNYICLCPECKKISEHEGSDSGLLLPFINYMATNIAKEYPEIKILIVAYVSSEKAAKFVKPAKNVIVRWCDLYTQSDPLRPLTHPINSGQKAILDAWFKTGARVMIGDYWNMCNETNSSYFRPVETMVDAIPADVRYFRDNGVVGIYALAFTFIWGNPQNFYDLHTWLAYQLMDEPDKPAEELINLFMDRHYGPAAEDMKAFLADLRKAVKGEKHLLQHNNLCRTYQTVDFLRKTYTRLKKARAKTPSGSQFRLRVEKELITPIANILSKPNLDFGISRKNLVKEYEAFRLGQINAYCSKKMQEKAKKELKNDVKRFDLEIPTPEMFSHLPPEKIQKFSVANFWKFRLRKPAIIKDADSTIGQALVAVGPTKDNKWNHSKPITIGLYDKGSKREFQRTIKDIPQDEKYHWYKIGNFDFGPDTFLWLYGWYMRCQLQDVYVPADGKEKVNIWETWVSLKFTGPAYVKASDQKDAVYMDQVIIVKE